MSTKVPELLVSTVPFLKVLTTKEGKFSSPRENHICRQVLFLFFIRVHRWGPEWSMPIAIFPNWSFWEGKTSLAFVPVPTQILCPPPSWQQYLKYPGCTSYQLFSGNIFKWNLEQKTSRQEGHGEKARGSTRSSWLHAASKRCLVVRFFFHHYKTFWTCKGPEQAIYTVLLRWQLSWMPWLAENYNIAAQSIATAWEPFSVLLRSRVHSK